MTIPNPNATAETRDMVFTFTGPYGPASPGASGNIAVANFSIFDLNTNGPVYFVLYDNILAGHSLIVDIGVSGVVKTTLDGSGHIIGSTSVLGVLDKDKRQFGLMRFRAQGDNALVISINGTPLGTLNGKLLVSWRPKASLA
jgi:hypothetical protein